MAASAGGQPLDTPPGLERPGDVSPPHDRSRTRLFGTPTQDSAAPSVPAPVVPASIPIFTPPSSRTSTSPLSNTQLYPERPTTQPQDHDRSRTRLFETPSPATDSLPSYQTPLGAATFEPAAPVKRDKPE